MRPKSNGLPPLCLYNGQGADLLQDPSVFCLRRAPSVRAAPEAAVFTPPSERGGLSILLIRPRRRTPPRLPPWGRRGAPSISQGRISCARHPARRKAGQPQALPQFPFPTSATASRWGAVGASVGVAPHVLGGIQGHAAALAKDPLFHIRFLLLFGRGAPLLCALRIRLDT